MKNSKEQYTKHLCLETEESLQLESHCIPPHPFPLPQELNIILNFMFIISIRLKP